MNAQAEYKGLLFFVKTLNKRGESSFLRLYFDIFRVFLLSFFFFRIKIGFLFCFATKTKINFTFSNWFCYSWIILFVFATEYKMIKVLDFIQMLQK